MPPKKQRLLKKDFNNLSKRSLVRNPLFDVAYITSPVPKIACVVSKKTLKKAVDRNKVKRKVYNAFRECIGNKNYIFIIYPKKDTLTTPYLKIKDTMQEIFATIN